MYTYLGYFYAGSKSDECILAMDCTKSNDILVVGDTNGTVSLFNICQYGLEMVIYAVQLTTIH